MRKSLVLRWLQKQSYDEDKSRMAAGREFQAAGPSCTCIVNCVRLNKQIKRFCLSAECECGVENSLE